MKVDPKQYNAFAKKYSEVFAKSDQESVTAYFRFLDFPMQGKKVLDLGCGDGSDLTQLKGDIYGIDASEEMVKIAQEKNPKGEIKVAVFEDIPFSDQMFDIVLSKWSFQSSPNIDSIYNEIARVLKPQGYLIFLTTHPMRQFYEKRHKGKNYFDQEVVESFFFNKQFSVKEPTHTLNDYLSPTFFTHFTLLAFEEGNDSAVERIDGDIYPSYFIIKARRKL